jgi:hypothetical protein
MLLVGFSAKVGRDSIFKSTNGNEDSHKISSDNGFIIVNFATSKNLSQKYNVLISQHSYKYTLSPDGKTCNQIDHILIEMQSHLSVLDV